VGPGLGLGVAEEAGQELEGRPAADLLAQGVGGPGQADRVLVALLPAATYDRAIRTETMPSQTRPSPSRKRSPVRRQAATVSSALASGRSQWPSTRSRMASIQSARATPASSPARRNSSRLSSHNRNAPSKSPPAATTKAWL
jgi:hypothetical protein